jgi:hypothetical protein
MARRRYHNLTDWYQADFCPSWDRIADPDAEPPGVEPGLQALIDEVRIVVQEESFIIKRAFPVPDEILTTFLQRVFQQSVRNPISYRQFS